MAEKDLEMLRKIWADQRDFNKFFWPDPNELPEQHRQTKEFCLCLHSEITELLRKVVWKKHSPAEGGDNVVAIREELSDIFKYLISLWQVWDVTPAQAMADYWRKSMICRQRHSQEFIQELDNVVVVDIDNVLADYTQGFGMYAIQLFPQQSLKIASSRPAFPL